MELQAQHRTVLGKKVSALRRQGLVPCNVYGKGKESLPLQVPAHDLQTLLHRAGHNDVVTLTVPAAEGYRRTTHETVMVRELETDPVSNQLLHAAFMRVGARDHIEVAVDLVLTGEAPGEKLKKGTVVPGQSSIHVTGTPASVPSVIEVDVSSLQETTDVIRVKDLQLPRGVEAVTDSEAVVATLIGRAPVVEAEEPAAPVEPEATPAGDEATEDDKGSGGVSGGQPS